MPPIGSLALFCSQLSGRQSVERVGRFAVFCSPLALALSQMLLVLKYRD